MKLIKTWESENDCQIGLFKTSEGYECLYRVVFVDGGYDEWNPFGGLVGYSDASFKTRKEAEEFIDRGLLEEIKNPEIWLEMVVVK